MQLETVAKNEHSETAAEQLIPVDHKTIDASGRSKKTETAEGRQHIAGGSPPDDLVRLTANHVDFGDDPFDVALSMPLGFGVLDWNLTGGTIRPTLTGRIYMNDSRGREAKVQMRFFDVFGTQLADRRSESFYPTSDGLQSWAVDYSPYANSSIEKVEVSILVRYNETSFWIYARQEYTS